jgi:hypothetical protein
VSGNGGGSSLQSLPSPIRLALAFLILDAAGLLLLVLQGVSKMSGRKTLPPLAFLVMATYITWAVWACIAVVGLLKRSRWAYFLAVALMALPTLAFGALTLRDLLKSGVLRDFEFAFILIWVCAFALPLAFLLKGRRAYLPPAP